MIRVYDTQNEGSYKYIDVVPHRSPSLSPQQCMWQVMLGQLVEQSVHINPRLSYPLPSQRIFQVYLCDREKQEGRNGNVACFLFYKS